VSARPDAEAPAGRFAGRGPQTPAGRFAAGAVMALLAFSLLVLAVDRLAPQPEGPDSSAYATAPAGLAAYADLLARHGVRVERRRRTVADGAAPARGTLVVLDPRAVEPEEAGAIASWVRAGGRLVTGGERGVAWLAGRVTESLPAREDGPARGAGVLAPVPETAGVLTVRPIAGGELHALGGALPLLGPPGAPLATLTLVGRGRVIVLADASPLQNRGLARADNAAFALALAGGGETVTFLETVHGYGASTGLGALPAGARWGLLGLLLAALAFVWSRARRIGPPQDAERPLPPPRADYVDALAGSLARTRRPAEVARPLQAAARGVLARRAGLGSQPRDAELRAAAGRYGLGEAETAALLDGPRDLEGALAAGRAHEILNGTGARPDGGALAPVNEREAG
jgi:Domain of unknown function (DUF4350)